VPLTAGARFRAFLMGRHLVRAPGAYDGITARLVAQAGFQAVYMTGAGVSAARGFPDYGLLTMGEMADAAGVIVRAAGIPLIADADTGYGNELNVTRTVQEYEGRGVAALHIEDQLSPKRCGHLAGKELVDVDEFVAKIRAAVAARRDPDFVVIARTDAIAVLGFDAAIARANAALSAGADMAFVEAPRSAEEMAAIPGRVSGPCLINLVPGGRTPMAAPEELARLGFRVAIYPGACLAPVVRTVDAELAALAGVPPKDPVGGPAAFFARLGSGEWDAIRRGERGAGNG